TYLLVVGGNPARRTTPAGQVSPPPPWRGGDGWSHVPGDSHEHRARGGRGTVTPATGCGHHLGRRWSGLRPTGSCVGDRTKVQVRLVRSRAALLSRSRATTRKAGCPLLV